MNELDYDPVLIALVRKTMPNLVAYDICGVQPMTVAGEIFKLRAGSSFTDVIPYHVALEKGYCMNLWHEMVSDRIIKDATYRKWQRN